MPVAIVITTPVFTAVTERLLRWPMLMLASNVLLVSVTSVHSATHLKVVKVYGSRTWSVQVGFEYSTKTKQLTLALSNLPRRSRRTPGFPTGLLSTSGQLFHGRLTDSIWAYEAVVPPLTGNWKIQKCLSSDDIICRLRVLYLMNLKIE